MRAWIALIARWVLGWAEAKARQVRQDASVEAAVQAACRHVGIPMADYGPTLVLGHKAEQVLYHAACLLDADHRFETVADVIEALR